MYLKYLSSCSHTKSGSWRQLKRHGTFSIRSSFSFGMNTRMGLVRHILQIYTINQGYSSLHRRSTWATCFMILLVLVLRKWSGNPTNKLVFHFLIFLVKFNCNCFSPASFCHLLDGCPQLLNLDCYRVRKNWFWFIKLKEDIFMKHFKFVVLSILDNLVISSLVLPHNDGTISKKKNGYLSIYHLLVLSI